MNLKDLATRAKELVDKRGGTGALKEDAAELKDIAKGEGSVTDKAKAAAEALKDPGAEPQAEDTAASPAAEATPAERERAAGKVKGEARGKHGGGKHRGGGQGKRRGGGGGGGGRGRDRL